MTWLEVILEILSCALTPPLFGFSEPCEENSGKWWLVGVLVVAIAVILLIAQILLNAAAA